jgi:hypothetical protein
MISNKNINNASVETGYTFRMFGKEGDLIGEYVGTTTAPVDGDFPIIKQAIRSSVAPHTVDIILRDGAHYTVLEKPTSPTLRIGNELYEAGDIPRVYAMVQNTKRLVLLNIPIRVVLFDIDNNAYAVGETVIPKLEKEEVKDVSFTWNSPLPFPPTRIRVYAIFDPFSATQ